MRLIALIACTCLCAPALAQQDRFILKFSPLHLADIVGFPTVQMGLETRLSPRVSWYNEAGIQCFSYRVMRADTSFYANRGFRVKTELRYYFGNHGKKTAPHALQDVYYVAVNAFLNNDHHNNSISYYPAKDSSKRLADNFGVHKKVWGLNFIFGYQEALSRRFLLDVYGGVGVRFRQVNTVHQEFNYDKDTMITAVDLNIDSMRDKVEGKGGFSVAPNLSLGVRFCYRLSLRKAK